MPWEFKGVGLGWWGDTSFLGKTVLVVIGKPQLIAEFQTDLDTWGQHREENNPFNSQIHVDMVNRYHNVKASMTKYWTVVILAHKSTSCVCYAGKFDQSWSAKAVIGFLDYY